MPEVVIIGASRGIGNALARAYASAGWQVVATARDAAGQAALDAVDGITGQVCDVTDEASLDALAKTFTAPIDLMIVNAGVMTLEANLAAVDVAEWTRIMTTNAFGPLLAARALSGSIRDGGKFVALSSAMGSIAGNAGGGYYSYRMSKAALNMGLTNLGHELEGRGITVAALHPGWVKTDMGGAGAAVEIADSVAGLRNVIEGLHGGGGAQFVDFRGNRVDW